MCVSVCLSACDGWVCGTKFASGCCFCKENAFKQIFFCTLTTISRRKRVGARPHVRGGVGRGVAEARGGGGRGRRGSGPAGPGGRNGGGGVGSRGGRPRPRPRLTPAAPRQLVHQPAVALQRNESLFQVQQSLFQGSATVSNSEGDWQQH